MTVSHQSKASHGVAFSELSRGQVKNYCCEQSLALDHHLLQLLQPERNLLDLYRDVLAALTNRLLQKLVERYQSSYILHHHHHTNLFIEGLAGK